MSLPEAIQPDGATHVRYRGRRLIYFGGCDYYRLAHHTKLLKAHAQAAARDGLGTGASRMTTGNHPAHDKLETSLVRFFGSETATVVGAARRQQRRYRQQFVASRLGQGHAGVA